jgi:hypothetical protein
LFAKCGEKIIFSRGFFGWGLEREIGRKFEILF